MHRRNLDARVLFLYNATGVTPSVAVTRAGAGSDYAMDLLDTDKKPFDGSKTYKLHLPPNVPVNNFWAVTLYDTQTRSMLDMPQRYPRAGSQSFPSPAAEPGADGSMTIYFGPQQPDGVKRGNWIQTIPGKGFIPCLRLYSPLEPFFAKTWKPGEVELVR